MRVNLDKSTERRTPPGMEDKFYLELRRMKRSERDRFQVLLQTDAVAMVEHCYEAGISGFRLPGEKQDLIYGSPGANAEAADVYEGFDDELAKWVLDQVMEFNNLLPEQVLRKLGILGNSTPPAGDEAAAGDEAENPTSSRD